MAFFPSCISFRNILFAVKVDQRLTAAYDSGSGSYDSIALLHWPAVISVVRIIVQRTDVN